MARRTARALLLVLLPLALVAAACGDDDDDTAGTTATTAAAGEDTTTAGEDGGDTTEPAAGSFPVTVDADNGEITVETRPEQIVSLSPTHTEILFAIGAGPQVVAVDDQSNYPPEAPMTDLSGFTPNVEAIAGYDPDLVFLSNDQDDVVAGLGALGIPVILLESPTEVEGIYDQIAAAGIATGNEDGAAGVVDEMRTEIDELLADVPLFDAPPRIYHELDPTFFSATSNTFVGNVYEVVGLANIADAAADGSDYPQLSAEFIVAEDPEYIFLADVQCCGQDAETVSARPGWDQIAAVRDGNIVLLNDDTASRWGPRITDFMTQVVSAVTQGVPEAQPAS